VIENRRLCRRKNGMANIFAGIDNTEVEYLVSLAASGSTSSIPSSNSTGAPAIHISSDGTSLNCIDSNSHESDDSEDDSNGSQGC